MLEEVLDYLNPKAGQVVVDCTLGGAGYALAIAEKVGTKGEVIGIDADELAIDNAKKIIIKDKIKNIKLIHDNFKDLQKIIEEIGLSKVYGFVFDLGLSSAQLEDRARGFAFNMGDALNMSFDGENDQLTLKIVNQYKKEILEKIIREYGEERYAGRIAEAIVKARRNPEHPMRSGSKTFTITSAKQLAEIISQVVPRKYREGRINPATRTFQALRIATNDELNNLALALPQAIELLEPNGKIVVVSYHSLEDRIVKNIFRQEVKDCICPPEIPICNCDHQAKLKILTKKVITASVEEIKNNPRARSAKLRAAERIVSSLPRP